MANPDKFSLVGDFGSHSRYLNAVGSLEQLGIGLTITRKGEDKAKPNPFEELEPRHQQFMEEHTSLKDQELFSALYKLKEKQLKHRGISFEDFKAKLLSKPVIDLNDLASMGCLDGFDYLDDRLKAVADGVKQYNILVPNKGNNYPAYWRSELGLEGLLNNRFRPL